MPPSCGGVVEACLAVARGDLQKAFAIVRPPLISAILHLELQSASFGPTVSPIYLALKALIADAVQSNEINLEQGLTTRGPHNQSMRAIAPRTEFCTTP